MIITAINVCVYIGMHEINSTLQYNPVHAGICMEDHQCMCIASLIFEGKRAPACGKGWPFIFDGIMHIYGSGGPSIIYMARMLGRGPSTYNSNKNYHSVVHMLRCMIQITVAICISKLPDKQYYNVLNNSHHGMHVFHNYNAFCKLCMFRYYTWY